MRRGLIVVALASGMMLMGCTTSGRSRSQSDGYRGDARADVLTPAEPTPIAEPLPAPMPPPAPLPPPTPAPAPVPAAPAAPVAGVTYTIKQGDNLWQIAKSHYGDGQKWKAIVDANPGLNPDRLQVGKTIVLP